MSALLKFLRTYTLSVITAGFTIFVLCFTLFFISHEQYHRASQPVIRPNRVFKGYMKWAIAYHDGVVQDRTQTVAGLSLDVERAVQTFKRNQPVKVVYLYEINNETHEVTYENDPLVDRIWWLPTAMTAFFLPISFYFEHKKTTQ